MENLGKLAADVERQLTLPGVNRKEGVFDQESFNAVSIINKIFVDEASLGELDKIIDVLKKQIRKVDNEIFTSVRGHGGAHIRAMQDVQAAHAQIAELFTKVQDIQRKAEESEAMVQEICRDIKKLDIAKRHLTNAITSLRRLAMLSAAITELEAASAKRDNAQYKKCANLLEAVHQLMEHFQQYEAVPKVKALSKRLDVVQARLTEAVLDDFKILMGQADVKLAPDAMDRLAAACLVVDALGPKVRDQLMDWLCDREMTIYKTVFGGQPQAPQAMGDGERPPSRLERFDRRFQWFRSRLDEKKSQWAIFPESWRVPQTLTLTFCKITKAALKQILSDSEAELRGDVGAMLKQVFATNKFEKEMAAMFGGGNAGEEGDDDADGTDTDHMSASEARRRLERFRNRMKQEAHKQAVEKMGNKAREAQELVRMQFEGSISEAFEDVLVHYVAQEEAELRQEVNRYLQEEYEGKWQAAEDDLAGATRVLQSANKLFLRIRASLTRCCKLVSRGPTLLALTHVFGRAIYWYSSELLRRLPKTAGGQTSAQPPYTGSEWFIRLPEEEERVVCLILHTAEFCRETTEGLAAAIQKDIRPALADKVDMTELEGAFSNAASQCMNVLVLGANTRLDAALQEMARTRWDAIEQPGDDSVFVNTVRKIVLDTAPRLGAELDKTSLAFFCDKMARMFVPRFADHVQRIRKISDKGTLQLSIDCDSVRRILLEFPRLALPQEAQEAGATPLPGYSSYVEREMGAIINMVKVLQSRPENLVQTFLLLMPAQQQVPGELMRICDMKGLTKQQQQQVLALYQHQVSGGDAKSAPVVSSAPSAQGGLGFSLGQPGSSGIGGGAVAANLGAFKQSISQNFSQLTSAINLPGRSQQRPPGVPEGPPPGASPKWAGPPPGVGSHRRDVSQGSSISLDVVKERTLGGFAKIGNLVKGLGNVGQDSGTGPGGAS